MRREKRCRCWVNPSGLAQTLFLFPCASRSSGHEHMGTGTEFVQVQKGQHSLQLLLQCPHCALAALCCVTSSGACGPTEIPVPASLGRHLRQLGKPRGSRVAPKLLSGNPETALCQWQPLEEAQRCPHSPSAGGPRAHRCLS